MIDPHAVLGVPPGSDADAIRRRYLELVRQFPPDRHPERFTEIRAAYDSLRDVDASLRRTLFEGDRTDSLEAILQELTCQTPRHRLTLEALLNGLKRS